MPSAERISRPATVATKRVGTAVWILRLDGVVTRACDLSSAFDEAIARRARDVVVEIGRRAAVDRMDAGARSA